MTTTAFLRLSQQLTLGALLERVVDEHAGYELLAHWTQGEFHHDIVLQVGSRGALPGNVLVVATNCNGGIKELLCFESPPERYALWHARCPSNPEFSGELPGVLAQARTVHWFDPCELLLPDARSEMRPECRRRQRGGGYEPIS